MPTPVRLAFVALLAIVAVDALHELFGLAGSRYSNLLDSYFYDVAAIGGGTLMVLHGLRSESESGWVLLGLGTFSWVVGDILSDLRVGIGNGVSVSDAFWVAWYPLASIGLFMLVHERFKEFDFARWIDGIALALVVATPRVALALQPAVDESHVSVARAHRRCHVPVWRHPVARLDNRGDRTGRLAAGSLVVPPVDRPFGLGGRGCSLFRSESRRYLHSGYI